MPTYKLYYFQLRGRAELARMIFAYAGVEYEDIRIPNEEWPAKKNDMPYRQMPVLEVDGKTICQSAAISRYLAREFGLAGKTAFAAAKADEFSEAVHDILMLLPWTEKDEEKKKELMKIALTEKIPPGLALLEENFEGDYYAGELTHGDIAFMSGFEHLVDIQPNILDATPKLKALYERVRSNPKLAKWLKDRPKTPM